MPKSSQTIHDALAAGRGAVFLGAHYGPTLYSYVLQGIFPDVEYLLAQNFIEDLQRANTLVVKPFRGRKIVFMNDPAGFIVSRKGERLVVDHIRAGGGVLMHVDFPYPGRRREAASFFGLPIGSHTFPSEPNSPVRLPV